MAATLPLSSASGSPVILARRYRLERRLAQGGMAEVWVATDLSLTRQVAVKLLKPSLAVDPVVAERFRREAIAVAQLSHPNIVAVFDAIEDVKGDSRRQAVVMQLVSGKSLRQLLDEQRRLSPALTIHIGKCVAAALDCAHRANLVHRDVKPGNILVTPDGAVLLTDFGIAKGIDDGDDLTSPNIMMGTAKYLSPEQVRGNRLDGRADLYSLGLVLYECLAGRVPFLGETDADTALARLNRDPTDLTRLRPTLPNGLAQLIHRLLARDPDARVANGADLRNELVRIESTIPRESSGRTPPAGRPSPPGARADAETATPEQQPGAPTESATVTPPAHTPGRGTPTPATTPPFDLERDETQPGATRPVSPTRPAAQKPGANRAPERTPPRPTGPRPPAGRPPVREPAARGGRPAAKPIVPDRTPANPQRPQPRPNREFEQRSGPTTVVIGALLLVAAIVAALIWSSMRDDVTLPPIDTSSAVGGDVALDTAASVTVVPAAIAGLISYDPDGDGEERQDFTALALDGDPTTAWETVCYADRYLGAKGRVGLVVDLGAATTATLRITVASAPSQIRVFTSSAEQLPTTFDAWGPDVARFDDTDPMVLETTVDARWVLLGFYELGPSEGCQDNPYRGAISEITLVA